MAKNIERSPARRTKLISTKVGKPWRKFEKVLAGLEEFLGPKGAIVKSPDVLPDKDTGSPIKVDGTIRYFDGFKHILIVLECRNRGRIQEVMWIRELATRKIDTQADILIGISSSDFTPEAVRKAKAHGLELRKLNNQLAGKIIDSYIFHKTGRLRIKNYEIALYIDGSFPDAERYFRQDILPTFYIDQKNINLGGNEFSLQYIMDYHFLIHPTLKKELEFQFEQESPMMRIELGYNYGDMFINTKRGRLFISKLIIYFVMTHEATHKLDRQAYQSYQDMNGNILAERLTFSRPLENGEEETYEWKRRPDTNEESITKLETGP